MTAGERTIWAAVYASSWHQSIGSAPGVVRDDERARWSAQQANRALAALKEIAEPGARLWSSDMAIEVLR